MSKQLLRPVRDIDVDWSAFWQWLERQGYERHPNQGKYCQLHYVSPMLPGLTNPGEHNIIYRNKRNELTFVGAANEHLKQFMEQS